VAIFMPDQFSKTLASEMIEPVGSGGSVRPTEGTVGKRVERKKDILDYHSSPGHHAYNLYSSIKRPDPEMWKTLREALERFNDHQDFRHSPYVLRLWAQNNGFRIQLIHEETGKLIKQTSHFSFSDLTADDLNRIINAMIGEEGVVIDLVR